MNWTSTSFVQTAPSASTIAITGVTDVEYARNAGVLKHSGDGDHFVTTLINDFEDPALTITHRDLTASYGIVVGARGTISSVHNDARYGVTTAGGGYTVALVGMVTDNPGGGSHRQFGQGRLAFAGESTDGVTNPMTFTAK
jgi:hypothetical protein